jgi:superfamily I DNA and/or RNA helicase
VIAPYSAQVARLQAALPEDVEVATVNAFQGREKEAILCTFVRGNAVGELGFVADDRRLTVALTRARRLLVLTGDSATLGVHPYFSRVMDAIQAKGGWRTVWEAPWTPQR